MNNHNTERIGSYEFNRRQLLGAGSFSNVYLGRHNNNKHFLVAVKEIDISKTSQNYIDEIYIIQQISNPHVIKIYDFYFNVSHSKLYIILEYCNQGSLIRQKKGEIREIYYYFQQILQGMKAMRALNILHRDLKLENILLRNNIVKISDFGLAKKLGKTSYFMSERCGTPSTMAPEILLDCHHIVKYDYKCDIWALGIILYELVYGTHPFGRDNIKKILIFDRKRIEGRRYELADDFIEKSLKVDAKNRVDWDEVFIHPINFLCNDEEFVSWKEKKRKKLKENIKSYMFIIILFTSLLSICLIYNII